MNKYTLIGAIGLLVAVGLAAFYTGKGQKEVTTIEKIVYKEGSTKIEYRDRTIIKEKITRPDGTTIEREITKDISKEIERRSREIAQEEIKRSKPILSKYSLGVKYWAPVSVKALKPAYHSIENVEVTTGYRVWGELWITGGYKLDNSLSVGLSLQF